MLDGVYIDQTLPLKSLLISRHVTKDICKSTYLTQNKCLLSSVFQTGLGDQSKSKYYKQKNHYHETFLVNFNLF